MQVNELLGKSEVAELQGSEFVDKDVGGLEVAVENAV
jgi:hypothetical protein